MRSISADGNVALGERDHREHERRGDERAGADRGERRGPDAGADLRRRRDQRVEHDDRERGGERELRDVERDLHRRAAADEQEHHDRSGDLGDDQLLRRGEQQAGDERELGERERVRTAADVRVDDEDLGGREPDRERPPRDVEAVGVGRQVADDGDVQDQRGGGDQRDEQPDGRAAQAHCPISFHLRRSSRCPTTGALTSCAPTSSGPTSDVRSSRSHLFRRPGPCRGDSSSRSSHSACRSSTAGWNGCAASAALGVACRERAGEVHPSGAIGRRVRGKVDRARLEQRLDLVGRQRGARLQHLGDQPGDDRGRLRRAAAAEEALADARGRELGVERRARHAQGDDRGARGDDVGRPDRVARGEVGDAVVGRIGGVLGVGGADGDQERIGGRQVEAACAVGLVARRRDDGDAAVPQLLGGVGERLAHVRAPRVDAEGEVEDPDAEPVRAPVAAHPVERHQHAHEAGDAVGARDLDADEPRARGDALVAGLGIGAARSRRPCASRGRTCRARAGRGRRRPRRSRGRGRACRVRRARRRRARRSRSARRRRPRR